jgi:hypothetical protein
VNDLIYGEFEKERFKSHYSITPINIKGGKYAAEKKSFIAHNFTLFSIKQKFTNVRICLLSRNIKVEINKTIILPFVLYGCETWSFTLREEHRLRVFENRVLRRLIVPKWDEVTGELRKLHNKELHILYSSPNIIRQIKSRN